MRANPLIERYRLGLRSGQFWLYFGLYALVVGLIITNSLALHRYQHMFGDFTGLCCSLYFQFLVVLGMIIYGWTTYNSGTTLSGEMARKTYDFFRLLPLPASQKAVGILIGRNLGPLLYTGITCLFLFAFGYFGEINRVVLAETLFVIFMTALLLNLTVLLGSSQPHKGRRHPLAMILILLTLLFPSGIALTIALFDAKQPLDKYLVDFYCLHIPLLIVIGSIALYLSIWVFTGIVRKLTLEERPLFSDLGAPLFVAGYCAIVLGLFWTDISPGNYSVGITIGYWFAAFLPLVFVPFGSLRNFDRYLEYTREIQIRKGTPAALMCKLFLGSNIFLGLVIFAVYAVFAIAVALMAGLDEFMILHRLTILLSFYAFLILLFETGVLYQPLFRRIGIVLGTLVFLYIAWPLFASAILEKEMFMGFSPIGALFALALDEPAKVKLLDNALLVNVLLCLGTIPLIWKRYRYLLTVRQKM
jgi:hypothetical protein